MRSSLLSQRCHLRGFPEGDRLHLWYSWWANIWNHNTHLRSADLRSYQHYCLNKSRTIPACLMRWVLICIVKTAGIALLSCGVCCWKLWWWWQSVTKTQQADWHSYRRHTALCIVVSDETKQHFYHFLYFIFFFFLLWWCSFGGLKKKKAELKNPVERLHIPCRFSSL